MTCTKYPKLSTYISNIYDELKNNPGIEFGMTVKDIRKEFGSVYISDRDIYQFFQELLIRENITVIKDKLPNGERIFKLKLVK